MVYRRCWPVAEPRIAVVRELLRQRAVAHGLLSPETADGDEVAGAIECLLGEEVWIPLPTDEKCRRHYETHNRGYRGGDLVYARQMLF